MVIHTPTADEMMKMSSCFLCLCLCYVCVHLNILGGSNEFFLPEAGTRSLLFVSRKTRVCHHTPLAGYRAFAPIWFFVELTLDFIFCRHVGVDWVQSMSSSGISAVDDVQLVLRVKVPDAHSECPLGEKYGAVEEICGELVSEPLPSCRT